MTSSTKFFHFFHKWSKWSVVRSNNIIRHYDDGDTCKVGRAVTQERTCLICGLVQQRSSKTYSV